MSEAIKEKLKRILDENSPILRRAAKDAFASGRHRLGKTRKELDAIHKKRDKA